MNVERYMILTTQEKKVYDLVCIEGMFDLKDIAENLICAVSTVRTHLNNIYRKMNVGSKCELVYKHYTWRSNDKIAV